MGLDRVLTVATILLTFVGGWYMLDKTTVVELNSPKICAYFEELGYTVPKETYQRVSRDGRPRGYRTRYILGTSVEVQVAHLTQGSHYRIGYSCDECGKRCSTLYNLYTNSPSTADLCTTCARSLNGMRNAKVPMAEKRATGVMGKNYWRRKLLVEGTEGDIKCDISGESDQRFLVIHHLNPRHNGGQEHRDNIVVLTANYHQAFHRECGGNDSACTPEQYYTFRDRERNRLQELRRVV